MPASPDFVLWFNRVFLDLGPFEASGNYLNRGVEFARRNAIHGERLPRLHGAVPASLRTAITAHPRLRPYRITRPSDLPEHLRTDDWSTLCDLTAHTDHLDPPRLLDLAWLLQRLAFHQLIVSDGIATALGKLSGAYWAEGQTITGASAYMLHIDGQAAWDISSLIAGFEASEPGDWTSVESSYLVARALAKNRPALPNLESWLDRHLHSIEARSRSDHETSMLMSRYYRVHAFLPQLMGDLPGMVSDMDAAERWAAAMTRDEAGAEGEWEVVTAACNESRIKEALVLGDFALAEQRARKAIAHVPDDPRPRMHLGQALVESGRLREAAGSYWAATRHGPPGNEIALFMAGQCHEAIGDLDLAAVAYQSALDIDPLAISALEGLTEVGRKLGARTLTRFLEERRQKEFQDVPCSEPLPYQRYAGQLG